MGEGGSTLVKGPPQEAGKIVEPPILRLKAPKTRGRPTLNRDLGMDSTHMKRPPKGAGRSQYLPQNVEVVEGGGGPRAITRTVESHQSRDTTVLET